MITRSGAAVMMAWLAVGVGGHGSLSWPPPRNAIDRFLPEYADGKSPTGVSCNCGNDPSKVSSAAEGCFEGPRATGGGQACFWFSQGCSVDCPRCLGTTAHSNVSLCGKNDALPTIPAHARTMFGDSYSFNPWMRPGSAPIEDPCGMAGGTSPANSGPGDAVFGSTPLASMGDLGSRTLPYSPSGVEWVAGEWVEVKWGMRFNHGGGYQYRLCPGLNATEACFKSHPMAFEPSGQQLEWLNGTRYLIPGVFVKVDGATWARNPIPRINFDSSSSGQAANATGCWPDPTTGGATGPACRQFAPPCPQDDGWFADPSVGTDKSGQGACSGDWTHGLVVDLVQVPPEFPPGPAVLGWRWDCEETTQVWANCADVLVLPGVVQET